MVNTFKDETFKSTKTLSRITIALLGILIFCCVLFFISSFAALLYPNSTIDLGDGESMLLAYMFVAVTALIHIPVFIFTVIFFLIWLYRSFSNLSALKARNLEFSPGWAVGWWFVPIFTLFRPFQVMRELWIESDPDFDEELGFLSSNISAPTIMGFWWAFWILTGIADRIAYRMEGASAYPIALIVASIFEIVAAGLLIQIILDIVKRQELRFIRIGETQDLPPAPPTFN